MVLFVDDLREVCRLNARNTAHPRQQARHRKGTTRSGSNQQSAPKREKRVTKREMQAISVFE